jgi:hypothetical protein
MPNNDVLLLDAEKKFIKYIHPAEARRLLKEGTVKIFIKEPFVLQQLHSQTEDTPHE